MIFGGDRLNTGLSQCGKERRGEERRGEERKGKNVCILQQQQQ